MKLREVFSVIYSFIIALLLVLMAIAVFMYINSKKLVESNITRHKSYEIAQELRKSSDDLTGFCRTFVETGDPVWERRYWQVLDIRNGKSPMPNGRLISLQDSMKKLGFTTAEFEKLKQAEKNSNDLVWTEKIAFNAIKGFFIDKTGKFTIQGMPDTSLARTVMFNQKYHDDKSSIMLPIDDCILMVMQRTSKEVEAKTKTNKLLLISIVSLIFVISIISIGAFFLIKNKIILQMDELKAAKEKAEKSEQKFRFLFEKSPDVVMITSKDGHFLECNQSALDFHQLNSLEELQKYNIDRSYFNEEDWTEFIAQLLKDGHIRNKEVSFRSLTSDETMVCLVSSELINYEGNEFAFLSWLRDITEMKQIENLMQTLSTVVSQNPAAIVITDIDGHIEYVNSEFNRITGYSTSELYGNKPSLLKSGYHPIDFYKKMWGKILSGEIWKGEIYNKRKDGAFFWEDSTLSPIFNKKNEITNFVGIKQDITPKKEAEIALIMHEKKLKELNDTKDRLFSIIGHDLRGPIGDLKTFLHLMISDYDLSNTEKLKKILELLHSSTCTTFDLLENLLLWARSQQNEMIFNPIEVNLKEIYEMSVSLLAINAKIKNITIHDRIPTDIIVKVDKNMILTVMRNLVMNGIKFTNKNKNIYVSASEDIEYYNISVKDEGIGIKPEDINKLFSSTEIFSNYGTSGERGTGLGLLLCKEYIEKNGGTIQVESELGKGSEFKFTLPKILV